MHAPAIAKPRFVVDSFDGVVTTLSAVIVSTGTPIAEATAGRFELGGKVPMEIPPLRVERESAGTLRIRCRFRDVDWQRQEDAPGFKATLFFATRVLHEGGPDQDALHASWHLPLRISSGPGFADLQRHLGGR